MYNAYEYISIIAEDVPSIKKVYRASGLSAMEELLSDLRNNPDCCAVIRDSGDGFINLKVRRLDNAYNTLYVFVKAKFNDHNSRLLAKRQAKTIGIALFDRMQLDARDYGDPAYGLDFEKIDYNEIGPIGKDYYGYSFGYTFDSSI
jgi:hypothetical protein